MSIELVKESRGLPDVLDGCDKDLGRQLRRTLMSVPAQIGEAERARKGNKSAKLQGALAEAKEMKVHLRLAVALGYVEEAEVSAVFAKADAVCGIRSTGTVADLRLGSCVTRQDGEEA